jgi:hypothetical protein
VLVGETPDLRDTGNTCPSSVALHFPKLGDPLCADEEVFFVEEKKLRIPLLRKFLPDV